MMRLVLIIIVFVFAFSFALTAAAQDRDTTMTQVEILLSDSLIGSVVDGQRVRYLVGARLRQGETFLRARNATQFFDRGEILFVGDVEIVERGDSLRADQVLYHTRTKIGRATGNVWLTDGEVVVMAPSGSYDTRTKHAVFGEGVTLVDGPTTLRSREGEYWSDERLAEFAGDVRLDEEASTLEADSISYFRDDEISIARGDVAMVHVEENGDLDESAGASPSRTILFGEHAYNASRDHYSRVTGNPLLVQIEVDSLGAPQDTLVIRSHLLEATRSDSLHRLVGVGAVRVWQAGMSAVGDSLVFDRWRDESPRSGDEEARLYRAPIAWMDDMQLNGDTLRVVGREGSIDTLFAWSNSFGAYLDSTLQRMNQIKGRDLVARFSEDSLRTIWTGPNAEAIYFLSNDEDELRGGVRGSGDEIFFRFQHGDLHQVAIISGTQGEYTPAEDLPDPYQLEGFRWDPVMQPQKDDLIGAVDLDAPFDSRTQNTPSPVAAGTRAPLPNVSQPQIPDGVDEEL